MVKIGKKGAELSITVIIVAILALLVLAVLSFIFMGRFEGWGRGVSSCTDKSGVCAAQCGDSAYNTEDKNFALPASVAKCPDSGTGEPQKCCTAINNPTG